MATKQVYDVCVKRNREIGLRQFNTGSFKPDMKKLFGEKKLIDSNKLCICSEASRSRHIYEDAVLSNLYLEGNLKNGLKVSPEFPLESLPCMRHLSSDKNCIATLEFRISHSDGSNIQNMEMLTLSELETALRSLQLQLKHSMDRIKNEDDGGIPVRISFAKPLQKYQEKHKNQ